MFNKPSISDYYRAVIEAIKKNILSADDKFILETETSKIVSHFLEKYILTPIKFDESRKETMKHRKEMKTIPSHRREFNYGGDIDFEYEIIDITLPIIPNNTISIITNEDLEPSSWTSGWSKEDFIWNENTIGFSIETKGYGFSHDDQQIINNVNGKKDSLHQWMEWVNKDIDSENTVLEKTLTPFVEERKKKLSQDGGRISSLSEKMGFSLEE